MRTLVGVSLLLAACSPQEAEPPVENAVDATLNELPETVEGVPIGATEPVGIVGEWRVAGINGEEFDESWTPTATISADTIRIQSQCIWFERRYLLEGMEFVPPPPILDDELVAMCARGLSPGERAMQDALMAAEWAYRLPDGALVFDGPEGSITLFTQ